MSDIGIIESSVNRIVPWFNEGIRKNCSVFSGKF